MGDAKSLFICINAEPQSFLEGRAGNVKTCSRSVLPGVELVVKRGSYSILGSELHVSPSTRGETFFYWSCFYLWCMIRFSHQAGQVPIQENPQRVIHRKAWRDQRTLKSLSEFKIKTYHLNLRFFFMRLGCPRRPELFWMEIKHN